jgi:hypothetical protein
VRGDRQGQDVEHAPRQAVAFDKFGDVVGGVGFTIFQIGSGGQYNVVQKG